MTIVNKKQRIGMIVHQDYYVDGRVRNYVSYLSQINQGVDVLCTRRRSDQNSNGEDVNVRIITIPISRYQKRMNYAMEYFLAFWLYFFRLTGLFFQNKYQVIHVHNMPDFLIFAALIPKIFGARLILDIHDPMPEFYQSKFGAKENSLIVRFIKFQEKLSIQFANAVVTANENFKEQLIQRGVPSSKVTVLPNVPNPKLFQPKKLNQNGSEKITLIYPGTIAPRYGLHIAIQAVAFLKEEYPNLTLQIIGSANEYSTELEGLSESLGVRRMIDFHPAVSIDRIPSLMQQATIGIYPAIPDSHMEIATPTKVQEFVAVGLPVIASRIKVLTQQFSDNAILYFPPGDAEQFSKQIKLLINNPSLGEKMVVAARSEWRKFRDWDCEEKKYIKLLTSLK
jgi:glycosyltransferase involved in cell wall biosynthesis